MKLLFISLFFWGLSFQLYSQIQSDTSDSYWSVVKPETASIDVDMGKVILGDTKDSLVSEFMFNPGSWKYRVDSIIFQGKNADAFSMVSGFPEYTVEAGTGRSAEFRFEPSKIGPYQAEIVIYTQADTLIQIIEGEGVEQKIAVEDEIMNFGIIEIFDESVITKQLIRNLSNENIEITAVEMLGPDMEQFEIVGGNNGFTLTAYERKDIAVRFKPKYLGRTSGQIGFYFDGAGSPAIAQLYGAGIGGNLCVKDDSAYVGETKKISIQYDNSLENFAEIVKSYSGTIRFEKTVLTAKDNNLIAKQSNDSTYMNFNGIIDGSSDILAEIELVCAMGKRSETTIDIENITWYDDAGNPIEYDSYLQSGTFKVLGICQEGGSRLVNPDNQAGIIGIYPNPAEDAINIELSLTEESHSELTIYNSMGTELKTILNEIPQTGNQTVEISTTDLSSGTYVILLKTPTIVKSRSFMIVR